jgi:hypothetical protein
MLKIAAATVLWHIVIIPTGVRPMVSLPDTYATEQECTTDIGPAIIVDGKPTWSARSRLDDAVQAYVQANGGDASHTRAYCSN